ncbi:hypothetical protein LOK49_LG02G01048 [Camellia lanceoleosa]|uniref:Uncharacterized protein n=1 Tax=Camellia lanceoleosa TaxID=1840588 RepID=A0ACC0ILV9_9ERIC|nr:hypothetical protein LOK49_LG02G01048 [Camellia lanceoleosa]
MQALANRPLVAMAVAPLFAVGTSIGANVLSLLRSRFLQSGRLVQDKRPSSVAASELGFLRQRHTQWFKGCFWDRLMMFAWAQFTLYFCLWKTCTPDMFCY